MTPSVRCNGVSNHAKNPSPIHLMNPPPAASTKMSDRKRKRCRNSSSASADSLLLRYFEELSISHTHTSHEISALQTCGRRPLSKFTLRGGPAGRITQKRRPDEAVPWQHIHPPTPSPTARTKTNKYPSLLQSVL